MASPWPVLPDVGSTIVPPARRRPARSPASIIRSPIRSLTLPPGFSISSLARIVGRTPEATRPSRTPAGRPQRSRKMPPASLKKIRPLGAARIPRIPEPLFSTMDSLLMSFREAFRSYRWIRPVLKSPWNRSPSDAGPSPQPRQKVRPVGAITGLYLLFGWVGLGPLSLVPGHLEAPPHP